MMRPYHSRQRQVVAFGDLIRSILSVNVTTNVTFWILSVVALEHYIVSHVIFLSIEVWITRLV